MRLIVCTTAVLGVLALLGPAAASAACPSSSASGQQYIDPLCQSGTGPTATHPSTTPRPAPVATTPSSTPTSSTPSSPSATSTAAQAATTTSSLTQPSSTSVQSSGHTLPYTGLELWPAAAAGIGLLGAGVALRRANRGA